MPKKLTPIQSIKAYCKEQCCAGDLISWKECTKDGIKAERCQLFSYRLGKRPKIQSQVECPKKHIEIPLNLTKKGHSDRELPPKINTSDTKNKLNPVEEENEFG